MATEEKEFDLSAYHNMSVTSLWLRTLPGSEYDKVAHIFEEYKVPVPNPMISQIAIAETRTVKNNDVTVTIVGLFCYQLKPHAEPMWVHPDFRGKGITQKLIDMVEPLTYVQDTYVVAETAESVRMCERMGLEKVEHPVYVKRVRR